MHSNDSNGLRIEAQLEVVREDSRTDYLFNTKVAAAATRMSANQFGTYWRRNREKFFELAIYQQGALAAELMAIFARADVERQRRLNRERGVRFE